MKSITLILQSLLIFMAGIKRLSRPVYLLLEVSVYLGESILSTELQLLFLRDLCISESLPQSAMEGNSARLEVEDSPRIHLLECPCPLYIIFHPSVSTVKIVNKFSVMIRFIIKQGNKNQCSKSRAI